LQAQASARQRWPAFDIEQSTQALPEGPQAPGELPMLQVPPPATVIQQPPEHGRDALQLVTHSCNAVSQEEPAGQSATPPQPQRPPPLVATHTLPVEAVPQSSQTAPVSPQAPTMEPVAQVPPLQQPPLQSWVLEQLLVHRCVKMSQA
jgi:hypothetical protein